MRLNSLLLAALTTITSPIITGCDTPAVQQLKAQAPQEPTSPLKSLMLYLQDKFTAACNSGDLEGMRAVRDAKVRLLPRSSTHFFCEKETPSFRAVLPHEQTYLQAAKIGDGHKTRSRKYRHAQALHRAAQDFQKACQQREHVSVYLGRRNAALSGLQARLAPPSHGTCAYQTPEEKVNIANNCLLNPQDAIIWWCQDRVATATTDVKPLEL